MLIYKAFKLRIYPNKEQAILINKTLGCSRLIYNYFLDYKINLYKNTKKSISYNACSKLLTSLKVDKPFLKEVDKFSLQNSLKDLQASYNHFFKDGFGYPKFKSKHNIKNSYTTNFTNNNIKFINNKLQLPKIGMLKYKGWKNKNIGELKIIKATISKNNINQYFCSVVCEVEVNELPKNTNSIGIDLGVKNFMTLSNKEVIENPRTLFKYENKLKKEQRKLSKKEKGSKNFEKQRLKLAKIHNKIANIRENFLQQVTTKLIRENQIICLEDLAVKKMLVEKHLSKEILNVSFNKTINLLKYKAEWYGRQLIQVGKHYPSSQLCNCCGYTNTKLTLKDREWVCPSCKTKHDRDFNASLNILKEGLRIATTT